jgi:phosphatidylinositol glycan class B
MLECVVWTISVYSVAGHKEWRFIHPLLPLLHVLAAKSLVDLRHKSKSPAEVRSRPTKSRQRMKAKPFRFKHMQVFPPIHPAHLTLLLLSLPASVYVVFFYCSAPISVMAYLRQLPDAELRGSVGFLMPCHSTPWQAYLHKKELAVDGKVWALGCEPPLGSVFDSSLNSGDLAHCIFLSGQNLTTCQDQTSVFYESPRGYLELYFPQEVDPSFPPSPFPASIPGVTTRGKDVWEHRWPKYLVLFGSLLGEDGVRLLLEGKGYGEIWKAGREWEGEGKRQGGVRVWRYLGSFNTSTQANL